MKQWLGAATVLVAVATSGIAVAAPTIGVKKVTISETETITASKKFTAADATKRKSSFSATKTYKTASGQAITGQQFLDVVNKLQGAAEKGGCDLGTGKTCSFSSADAKLTSAQLNTTAKVAGFKLGLKRVAAPTSLGGAKTTAPSTASSGGEAKDPLGFSWSNEWGNRSTGAVYVGVEFGNGGSATSTSCGGAAYAGVYLFNNKKEVIRLEGEASSSGTKFNGAAELFVLGDSVWSKSGSFNIEKLKFEKTFSISKSFTYWGLVTVNLKAKATGTAWIDGSISGAAKTGEFTCSLNVTPAVKATVTGSAEVAILGYGDLSAAAVGVEANVVLADVTMPIVASVSAKNANGKVSFTESLSADLNAKFLEGSLDVYFKTSIPLDGEKVWDWDSDKFSFTLVDFDGVTYNKNLFKKSQTQTL